MQMPDKVSNDQVLESDQIRRVPVQMDHEVPHGSGADSR